MNFTAKDAQAFTRAAQADLGRHVSESEAKQIASNVINLIKTLTDPIDSDGDVAFMEKNLQTPKKSNKVIVKARERHEKEVVEDQMNA